MENVSLRPAGVAAIVIDLGGVVDVALNRETQDLARRLRQDLSPLGVSDVTAAYSSVLVSYSPDGLTYDDMERAIRAVIDRPGSTVDRVPRRFVLPVAYGGIYGPDLDDVAARAGLASSDVIALHAERDYPIYCIGFSPGFPYLGGLDQTLHVPRLDTPRVRVPAGTVAIAGRQTGVYPTSTPGGWRLIGRTPLVLFDAGRRPPIAYEAGDVIRFVPIGAEEYERQAPLRLAPIAEDEVQED